MRAVDAKEFARLVSTGGVSGGAPQAGGARQAPAPLPTQTTFGRGGRG